MMPKIPASMRQPKAHHTPGGGGHGMVAPGSPAKARAIPPMAWAGRAATHRRAGASGGKSSIKANPAAPGSATNGRSGGASTFAGREYMGRRGASRRDTGKKAG